jgi:1-phosphofructokinase
MIYTITLNPALDKIILMDEDFVLNKTNYYQSEYTVVGGKGINVGVILNNLDCDVLLTGILGNENKEIFKKKFKELSLNEHFFLNIGNTRTNYKIKNLTSGQETELNGAGFITEQQNITDLLSFLKANLKTNDIVAVTGSIPKNVDTNIYQQIGSIALEKNAIFICDAANEVLENALKVKPFLIKPNLDELKALLKIKNDAEDFNEIKNLISKTRILGARNILLSMGSKGSYYFSEDESIYEVGIAKGTLVNSVGAGDSMLAGFVYGIEQKLGIEECLKYAAAAGGATAFTEWLATKDAIKKYTNEITVKKIN